MAQREPRIAARNRGLDMHRINPARRLFGLVGAAGNVMPGAS